MTELYKTIGQSVPETLEAGGGKQVAISMEPGNGTVKHGTVLYRKSNGFYAPAAAGNITDDSILVLLVNDTDTDQSENVATPAAVYISGEMLYKDVVLADGVTTLNAAQAHIMRKLGFILAPLDELKSADVIVVNAFAGVTVDADIEDDDGTMLLGKVASDLQENIVISEDEILGTLKYIADYSSAGYLDDEKSGNFLALHFETDAEDATIKVRLVNGAHPERTLDDDGLAIFRITNKETQTIKVTVTAEGYKETVKTYGLTGLTLNNA